MDNFHQGEILPLLLSAHNVPRDPADDLLRMKNTFYQHCRLCAALQLLVSYEHLRTGPQHSHFPLQFTLPYYLLADLRLMVVKLNTWHTVTQHVLLFAC